MDIITLLVSIFGSLLSYECVKFFYLRHSSKKQAVAEAEKSQFDVLKDTVLFLQEQLSMKEQRFAEQTDLVRKLNEINLKLSKENEVLKWDLEHFRCNDRDCNKRIIL